MNLFLLRKNKSCKHIMRQSTLKPVGDPKLRQRALLLGKGEVIFGNNVYIGYFPSPYFYSTYAHIEARNKTAKITIQDGTIINNNACIIANSSEIIIGKNCRIGANFCCFDSDFHGLSVKERDNPSAVISKSVLIGDNVFIGQNVTILKGVKIGDNVVIGNGAVVTKSFPDNVIIAGNPAKIIKKIEEN